MNRRAGFTIIEVLLVIVALAIVGGVGYMAYSNFIAKPAASDSSASATETASKEAVNVDSSDDIDKVTSELNDTSLDDSDGSALDTAANNF